MKIIDAHGGSLINLIPNNQVKLERQKTANELPDWSLTDRQICDIELILNGAFSPLKGFMNQADYNAVLKDMRLADGTLWPMPITLDVDEKTMQAAKAAGQLTLRDMEGVVLAVLKVEDAWQIDKQAECQAVYGTTDLKHPAVNY